MSNVSKDSIHHSADYLPKTEYTSTVPLTAWENDKAIRMAPAQERNPAWLTKNEKLFLFCLNSHDGGKGIFAKYDTIKRETGINSDTTIAYLIKCLVIKGWLTYIPGTYKGDASEYKILVPAEAQRVGKETEAGREYVGQFIYPEKLPERYLSLPLREKPRKDKAELTSPVTVDGHSRDGSSKTPVTGVQVDTSKRTREETTVRRSAPNQVETISIPPPGLRDFPPAVAASLPVPEQESLWEDNRGYSPGYDFDFPKRKPDLLPSRERLVKPAWMKYSEDNPSLDITEWDFDQIMNYRDESEDD